MTTKADTYTRHDKAFEKVSAYVIVKDGKLIGSIAFKFPRDGMGRLYAYLHIHGTGMVRGSASGCGYDKRTAALDAFNDLASLLALSAFLTALVLWADAWAARWCG